jgi:hypothetical protein
MRKIEAGMINAIANKKNWKKDNTRVLIRKARIGDGLIAHIYLHDNHLACAFLDLSAVSVNTETLRQWPTPTTKSRLRALGVHVETIKGKTYIDDELITG